MKTSNNSPADNEVAENDTPNALISDNDLLKFFNLERGRACFPKAATMWATATTAHNATIYAPTFR